jgi:hypothetical protein
MEMIPLQTDNGSWRILSVVPILLCGDASSSQEMHEKQNDAEDEYKVE